MPTTYTHDLFGKKVYKKLPQEMKQVIRENKDLYRIGLHGPDVLFYYMLSKNPVTAFGVQMHQESAISFFERGMNRVRKTGDRKLLAYLLGFACHYLLDSSCHPYVIEKNDLGEISHADLETEFDRYLMEGSGKDPLRHRPASGVIPKMEYAKVIHRAIPEVKTINIYISLIMMKQLTNFTVCNDGGLKRKIAARVLILGGRKMQKELTGHFMNKHPLDGSKPYVEELDSLFARELLTVCDELQELYELSKEKKELSPRWGLNYNGKHPE